jgi:hypothetical protein
MLQALDREWLLMQTEMGMRYFARLLETTLWKTSRFAVVGRVKREVEAGLGGDDRMAALIPSRTSDAKDAKRCPQ